MAAMPPTGRLIQKHCDAVRMGGCCMQRYPERPTQRQVSLSVKAPPSRGPMTAAIAYMGPDHTKILRALGRRCGKPDNAEQADSHARAANTLDRSTDDQRAWILCHGAYDAAELEDQDADQVPYLDGHVLVEFAPGGLQAAKGHEVRCAVP
jgi:hypothetical protein